MPRVPRAQVHGQVVARERHASKAVIDGHALRIACRAEYPKVTRYAGAGATGGSEPGHALVEKIGMRFNAELARGEHHSRFGPYDGSR
jgi:hypothetical protein